MIESEATMEKVIEAAKIADIHDFIISLPQVSEKIKPKSIQLSIKSTKFRDMTLKWVNLAPSFLGANGKELLSLGRSFESQ